jgi:LacI family transcriptional regulator
MSVTIREVASRAGVSIATVSRVFNNSDPVDVGTRERVKKAASELRYVPNVLGRSLSMRRTDSIGLLLPDLFGEFFSEVIRGCDQTAQQNNFHLLVSSSHNNRQEIESALRMMRGRVDGLIIMSPHIDASALNENLPRTLPVVLLNCHVDGNDFDSVNIDNRGGVYQMVKHLLSHGHTRIGILKGTEHNIDAAERLRGYREAIAGSSASVSPALEVPGDFSEASGYDAARNLLSQNPRPTAVVASNDSMAIGALSAIRELGLRVPEDIALVGFDDIPVAAFISPALTTVNVDIDGLGVTAIRQVIHAVKNRNAHTKQQFVLPTKLSVRQSCGCGPHASSESTTTGERR